MVALLGTGLLTIALGLLAYDLAGGLAGTVLGTALAIKMVAYVTIAPITTVLIGKLPRKQVLIAMDAIRAIVALACLSSMLSGRSMSASSCCRRPLQPSPRPFKL